MNGHWHAWRTMVAVWLPALVLCIVSIALYGWQTSGTVGRAAKLSDEVAELERDIDRLRRLREQVVAERTAVAILNGQLDRLYGEVFGDLEARLVRILRAVGLATREAGLVPDSFGYGASEDSKLQHTRFTTQFAVDGEYQQIRRLLAALQESPEFLIVENLAITGEQETVSRQLQMAIRIATYLAEADAETLRRLTGGIQSLEKTEDVAGQR